MTIPFFAVLAGGSGAIGSATALMLCDWRRSLLAGVVGELVWCAAVLGWMEAIR